MGTAFVFKDSSFESWNFSILKISKMILKMMIVILAALLIAVEAKSGQDLIGERLKGFHDHFTSQAKVITDAGINTENIMNSLSTQLKSLLQDAVKEMDSLEENAIDLQHQLDTEKKKTEYLQKENGQLKKDNKDLLQKNAEYQGENERLTEENNVLKEENKNLTKEK